MPIPVTMPNFEQRNTVADIMGKVSGAVHRSAVPNAAPALAEVPIALGSSLAAPETTPGPSNPSTDRSRRCFRRYGGSAKGNCGSASVIGTGGGALFGSGGMLGAV